jgi:hypothetical protein
MCDYGVFQQERGQYGCSHPRIHLAEWIHGFQSLEDIEYARGSAEQNRHNWTKEATCEGCVTYEFGTHKVPENVGQRTRGDIITAVLFLKRIRTLNHYSNIRNLFGLGLG